MRELDLKCLRVDLDDRTLTPLEKIAQVVSKLGVAEPQSHPQKALPECPVVAVAYSHCHRKRRLVNARMSRWEPCRPTRGAGMALADLVKAAGGRHALRQTRVDGANET